MKSLAHVRSKIAAEYIDYTAKVVEGRIDIKCPGNYKDLTAWRMIHKELASTLFTDSGVKAYEIYDYYEAGIQEWNKDLCFISIEIEFYQKH